MCVLEVVYIGKLLDGTIFERKGSHEEPFEYVCLEGNFLLCLVSSKQKL